VSVKGYGNVASCDIPHARGGVLLVRLYGHDLVVVQRGHGSVAGHYIRAAIWGCLGFGMLCWWQMPDHGGLIANMIPDPEDFDKWLKGSAWVVSLGALATFVRWRKKQQAMQVIPTTMPTWTPPKAPANDNLITLFVKDKS